MKKLLFFLVIILFPVIMMGQVIDIDKKSASGGGAGDVTKVGTPVNNQVGIWTGDGTIEGDANLTWTGTELKMTGDIDIVGKLDFSDGAERGYFDVDVYEIFNYIFDYGEHTRWTASGTTTPGVYLTRVTNSADHIGYKFNTPDYTTAGAKLFAIQNNSIEKLSVDKDGVLVIQGQTKARGGLTIGDESITGTDITKIDSVTMVDSKYAFFHGADTTAPYTPVADQVVIGETAHLLEDTVSVFTFGAGMEIAGDTALFNDGSEFGSFYHLKDTFIVTNLVTALSSGDTLDFYIVWDELPDTGGDTLVNAGSSIDGGHTAISSFDDTKIPPGRHVWCDQKSTTHGRNPIKFRATLLGYLKRD